MQKAGVRVLLGYGQTKRLRSVTEGGGRVGYGTDYDPGKGEGKVGARFQLPSTFPLRDSLHSLRGGYTRAEDMHSISRTSKFP